MIDCITKASLVGFVLMSTGAAMTTASAQTATAAAPFVFNVTLTVPIQLKDLHPSVTDIELECTMFDQTRRIDAHIAQATVHERVKDRGFTGTEVVHLSKESATGFQKGAPFGYSCALNLERPDAKGALVRGNIGQEDWTQVGAGTNSISGTFTVP